MHDKIISPDVPKASILGSLLFNFFLYDLFLTINNTNSASYTGDITPYATIEYIDDDIGTLEETASDKCHLILDCCDQKEIKVDDETIKSSFCEELRIFKLTKTLMPT